MTSRTVVQCKVIPGNGWDGLSLLDIPLKDVLLRMNFDLHSCRGQCYDGAANMSGTKNGVSSQIKLEESRVIFVHCYGHALNLVAGDCKNNAILRDTLDTT